MTKQRVFVLINHDPYQNIFQLTVKFYRLFDVIVLLVFFCT